MQREQSTEIRIFSRTLDQGEPLSKQNVSVAFNSLVGREEALATACSLLRQSHIRLLTLTGTSGVGKTRLGFQIATEVCDDFADGVFAIPLAAVHQPAEVIAAIAHALGLRESGDLALFENIKTFLSTRELLLLLDNFEHVLTAAPLLTDLLATCPRITLLVTSRSSLQVQGEYEFPVLPLSLPIIDQLPIWQAIEAIQQAPASALFVQRAQAARPDFQLTEKNAQAVVEICARLDGLPLALELAAARCKLFPPQALLARLSHRLEVLSTSDQDVPLRQRTLRGAIAWSYDLLSPEEQTLFRRLAVFVNGCQLEAIEALGAAFGDLSLPVLDVITALIDQSLVQRIDQGEQEPRLLLLETIREFALERLVASGELERVQEAHAAYYTALAEQAEPELYHHQQCLWLERLEQDHGNLRAALTFLHEHGERLKLAHLVGTLTWFWYMHGLLNEGQQWAERTIATDIHDLPDLAHGKVIAAAGMFAGFLGQNEHSFARCQESLPLCRAAGDIRSVSASTYLLVHSLLALGEITAARTMAEDMLAFARAAEDTWVVGAVHCMLGSVALYEEDYEQSREVHEKGIAIFEGEHDMCMRGITGMKLANVYVAQGNHAKARELIQQGVSLLGQVGATWALGCYFTFWGQIALRGGQGPRAHFLLQEALSYQQQMGDQQGMVTTYALLAQAAVQKQNYGAACTLAEQSLRIAQQFQDTEAPIACLEGLAAASAEQGDAAWAAQLWGTIEHLYQLADMQPSLFVQESRKPLVNRVREQLGEQVFAASWAEGQKMTPAQVLAVKSVAKAPQPLLEALDAAQNHAGLTKREQETLWYLAQGLSNAQIADQLVLAPNTVSSYLRTIYSKLGVTSRTGAIRFAIDHKLVV